MSLGPSRPLYCACRPTHYVTQYPALPVVLKLEPFPQDGVGSFKRRQVHVETPARECMAPCTSVRSIPCWHVAKSLRKALPLPLSGMGLAPSLGTGTKIYSCVYLDARVTGVDMLT